MTQKYFKEIRRIFYIKKLQRQIDDFRNLLLFFSIVANKYDQMYSLTLFCVIILKIDLSFIKNYKKINPLIK